MVKTVNPRLGAFKDVKDSRDFTYKTLLARVNLPPSVDYESALNPPRDQYQRGACVSFACCAVKEYQEEKERPYVQKKKIDLDLSEEFVYMQIRQKGGGAYPRDSFKLLQDVGTCKESLLKYRNKRDDGKDRTDDDDDADEPFNPVKHKRHIANARRYRAKTYARISSEYDMMHSIATNGPVMIGITWLNGWFNPGSNKKIDGYPVLDVGQGAKVGGHALAVVGYDAVNRVFKLRNSWGKDWAKGGYAYLTFEAWAQLCDDSWATVDNDSPLVNQKELKRLKKKRDDSPLSKSK